MFRLTLAVVILVLIGSTVYAAYTDPAKLPAPLQPFGPKLKTMLNVGVQSSQTALSKTKDLQPAVMGAKTESTKIFQEDTSGKPIHQQAMEFTQYEYCKMIVKGYEDEQNKTAEPAASPTATPSPEKN